MVSTKLLTEGMKVPGTDTLDHAAATSVWAATASGVRSGSYLAHERIAQPSPNALDEVVAADLYDHTITSLGLAPARSIHTTAPVGSDLSPERCHRNT
jgi:hypothetical protein